MCDSNNDRIPVGSFFLDDWKDLCFRKASNESEKFNYVKMDSSSLEREWDDDDSVIDEFEAIEIDAAILLILKRL